jgi:hypothetical protein
MIRRYFFVTENRRGSGFRTRLTDLVRQDPPYEHDIDCDSVLNPTYWRDGHEFDCSYAFAKLNLTRINFAYFDYPVKNSLFGAPETITFTGDMVESSFEGGGSATALGATSSKGWSAGGTVCVGLGATVWCSDNSVGGNFSYSRSRSKGLLTLIDLDGDGVDELVTIEPFHGNTLNVYKCTDGQWNKLFQDELWFGHGLSAGMFNGEPIFVVGNRRGPLTLNMYRRLEDGSFSRETLEEEAGPTQTLVFTADDGTDYILSANQLKNEVALYY